VGCDRVRRCTSGRRNGFVSGRLQKQIWREAVSVEDLSKHEKEVQQRREEREEGEVRTRLHHASKESTG
jgi:hypothetical protein